MVRSYLYLFVILGSITALGWWSERLEGQVGPTRGPAQSTLHLGEQKAQISSQTPSSVPFTQPLEIEALTGESRVQ